MTNDDDSLAQLKFEHNDALFWSAAIDYPDSPFAAKTIAIIVDGREKPMRDDKRLLVENIVGWLPELMPVIVMKLAEHDPLLNDPQTLRRELTEPMISLFASEGAPALAWTFIVERPLKGKDAGVHVEFVGREFIEIWEGD